MTLGLIFGQPSTRTRISFGVAIDPARRRLRHAHPGRDAALARRVAERHGTRALALRRRARDPRPLARRARGVGRGGVDPGDQRADVGRASVPGARRRADDPRAPRRSRRRPDRLGRRRHERARLARPPREPDRNGGRRRLPGGLRAAGRHAARARARPARGRRAAPTSSSPTSGSRSARRPGASSGCAISSRTASTSRSSSSPHPRRSSCTACRPIRARRSRRACSTATTRRCGTRPRTACTCRRRCSRCCSAEEPTPGKAQGLVTAAAVKQWVRLRKNSAHADVDEFAPQAPGDAVRSAAGTERGRDRPLQSEAVATRSTRRLSVRLTWQPTRATAP